MVCSRCGARVFVAVEELGASSVALVLDAEPDPGGAFWILEDGRARSIANDPREGVERYTPHPQTCAGRRAG